MVNMTHRPNIHMRLRTLELRLRHRSLLLLPCYLG
jgi:hypothetical protein